MKKSDTLHNKPLVVHIIDRLPPDGAERLLTDVLKNRSDNYKFIVLCLIEGGLLVNEIEKMGVPVVVLGRSGRYDILLLLRLVSWLRKHRPLVVHTHLFTADSWGRLAAFIARVPGIFSTVHSVNSWKSTLHKFVDRLFSLFTTQVIACSDEVAQVLTNTDGIPINRVVSIANGVSLERLMSIQATNLQYEFGIENNVTTLIIVGRLHEAKGHMDLIPVFKKLVQHNHKLCLLIVGEGELESQIVNQISKLDIEKHVILSGFRSDVLSIIAACDVVVMPSRWEGLPMALLESMALEKPVVATNVGGIPNVIHDNENGLLVEAGDMAELEQKLNLILENKVLRDQLAEQAKATVLKHYSAKTVSIRYEELYDEVRNKTPNLQIISPESERKGK
ncbi:MAG: glycosyltransferase [Thiohalomonadales bacterium]